MPHVSPGVRHMAASAFFFSLMSLLVKLAGERLPSNQIVLARGVVCLVLSWAWLRSHGIKPWGNNPRALVLRGLFGTLALLCFYYTLVTLPFAESVVLQHLNPIFAAVLAGVFLGERVGSRLAIAIALCLAGVLAITRPAMLFGGSELSALGVAAGIGGAVCSSLVFVLIRSFGAREDPLVIVFYFPLVTVPVVLPLAVADWVWPTALEWLVLGGVGLATQLAQVHMTRGLALESAGRASSILYLQVALAALWGALFFDEIPDLVTLAGAGLIVAGTLLLVLRERPGRGIVATPE
ncbi:MAG TPA: DMT family transporter [Kofleriaceae bacterium]|nr:DMT family transporter [Kofleriaceae bacterium]